MERPTGLEPEATCITIRGSCIVSSYLKGFYSTGELLTDALYYTVGDFLTLI